MDNLKYAVNVSYDIMVKEINEILNMTAYADVEKKRLFYACGTCLHWILDYAERVELSDEDKKYMSAFRYANNTLKHGTNLFELTEQTGGMSFPMEFPCEIEVREIRWKELIDNGRFENQYNNYMDCIYNKEVVGTCKKAIDILFQSNVKSK